MTKKKLISLLLAAVMLLALAACGPTTPATESEDPETPPSTEVNDQVLVIGVDGMFDAKWNPFLAETYYDTQVVHQVFAPVCQINADNELEPYAGNVTAEQQDDGHVIYTVTLNEGMTFSDGTPVTIDDYIYGIYVRSDPSYTGPNNMISSHILGVEEYYYGNPNYSADIAAIEAEAAAKYAADVITFEDFLVYAEGTSLEGWWSGDPAGDIGDGRTWSEYAVDEGYEADLAAIDATDADAMFELIAKIEYDVYVTGYNAEGWYLANMKSDYALGNIGAADEVTEIAGIKKIDELTCTIEITIIDIYADRGLTVPNGTGNLIPRHYYGEITKGDVSAILANMTPMGSGPYMFKEYKDNIVTATANADFFLGVPKTGTVRWQYIPQNDVLENLASGAIDIANPTSSKENVAEIQTHSHLRYDLIDNPGYGYMAMNCENVSLYARKAVWSLMNRQPSVEGFYGTEIAKVIERPMTTTLAEYPDDATEYYGYSRENALAYFEQAGYTQDASGKLVNAAGEQFVINCYIGGDGKGAHPAYAMLVQASQDLATLGGELQIQDVDFNVLMAAVDDGLADMWIMAWTSVYDCDKSTQFRSTGGQNKYKYSNPAMDALLDQIVQTIDLDARRALVAEMLDLAMEDCIEFPLYQRKNMIAYNGDNVDLDSIPFATTAADYTNSLWQVVVK